MTEDLGSLFDSDLESAHHAAARVKALGDVTLPRFTVWNYEPCSHHDEPKVDCEYRECGGELFQHQRIGTTWLYFVKKGILADMTGLGKTNQILALQALLHHRDELTGPTVIVSQPTAVEQWAEEFHRFAPGIRATAVLGDPARRRRRYSENHDVYILGYQMMLKDANILGDLGIGLLVEDDVDPIRTQGTKTASTYNRLAATTERVVNINATPMQVKLQELYNTSVSVGGVEVFGSLGAFERRYVRTEAKPPVVTRIKRGKNRGKIRIVQQTTVVGYQNFREFKDRFGPFYLRRRYDQISDVHIPEVLPHQTEWLDLHDAQRAKYAELQQGILRIIREQGVDVKFAQAWTRFLYGAEICSGLPAIGEADGPGQSVKLDRFMTRITGDWVSEKVVVFCSFKGSIRAMQARLQDQGIGMALFWGDTPGDSKRKQALRKVEQDRFWSDPNCRVAVGTTAIERSLNLQIARIVLNYDSLLNPQRMVQMLGRVRRVGSAHTHVLPISFMCRDTQEAKYPDVLAKRAAVFDGVFSEQGAMFQRLDAQALLDLMRP